MKKLFRMLIFPAIALYITSLWNKGFILPNTYLDLIKLIILMALIFYLLVPLSKVVLFPLNLITFGLASFFVFILCFYLLQTYLSLITVKTWLFPGFQLLIAKIPKMEISYFVNLILSSLSVSSIINLLETFV